MSDRAQLSIYESVQQAGCGANWKIDRHRRIHLAVGKRCQNTAGNLMCYMDYAWCTSRQGSQFSP